VAAFELSHVNTPLSAGPRGAPIFRAALVQMLQLLLIPGTCDYGIANERVDAFAGALLALIAIDPQVFTVTAMQAVQAHPPTTSQALLQALERLVGSNNVDIRSLARPNKLAFTRNFRAFMLEIGALLTVR
jgi:hypothetical protein